MLWNPEFFSNENVICGELLVKLWSFKMQAINFLVFLVSQLDLNSLYLGKDIIGFRMTFSFFSLG